MAERRMIRSDFLFNDLMTDLDSKAAYLYVCLGAKADDDGFIDCARGIARFIGAGAEELAALERSGLLITFPSGVSVIRHWLVHNSLRKDRYTPTLYQDEMARLRVGRDRAYYLLPDPADNEETDGGTEETISRPDFPESPETARENPPVGQADSRACAPDAAERRADHPVSPAVPAYQAAVRENPPFSENRAAEQGSSARPERRFYAEDSAPSNGFMTPPTREEVRQYAIETGSLCDAGRFYDYYSAQNWRRSGSGVPIRDWRAAFRCWESREREFGKPAAKKAPEPQVTAQQYEQRDYSHEDESAEDLMRRLMARRKAREGAA